MGQGVRVKLNQLGEAQQAWLAEYLGPRSYELNEGMGGPGWRFRWDRDGYYLVIDDEKVGTMYMLKWGMPLG